MIRLISIHIPKTAGTSFHQVLQTVYGENVSHSLRRRDVSDLTVEGHVIGSRLDPRWTVLHGHLRYAEIAELQGLTSADMICWLRHPADRVISNHAFFIDRLAHPEVNPEVSTLNAHRREETLLDYASLPENRNRMSWFLEGANLDTFDFIGFQEHFNDDLALLARRLRWPHVEVPRLNERKEGVSVDPEVYEAICAWNEADLELYQEALRLRASGAFNKTLS